MFPPFLTSQQYPCKYTSQYRGATARGIVSVSSGDEDSLLTAVATVGPIAVYMDASHTSFQVIIYIYSTDTPLTLSKVCQVDPMFSMDHCYIAI